MMEQGPGRIWVKLDANGFADAFYVEDVHGIQGEERSRVPIDAMEITRQQWGQLLDSPNDQILVDGQIVPSPYVRKPEPPADLAQQDNLMTELEKLRARIEELEKNAAP